MTSPYTTVLGVDYRHLRQLAQVWPTWARHKPGLLNAPMVIFYDAESIVSSVDIRQAVPHPNLRIVSWAADIRGPKTSKWNNPQRAKMLAGFVHVPPLHVRTPYWLKIDTDTVASGHPEWISNYWFDSPNTAIVAQKWGYTKPPNQMQLLDDWVAANIDKGTVQQLAAHPPLNLVPNEGSNALPHARIISWCGFFNTAFTAVCSRLARDTETAAGTLPVPSQDGFMWYVATRMGLTVKRVDLKSLGWEHWGTEANITQAVARAMTCR